MVRAHRMSAAVKIMIRSATAALSRPLACAALLLSALSGVGSAQRGAPLLKTDLIQLLSSPVIAHEESCAEVGRS